MRCRPSPARASSVQRHRHVAETVRQQSRGDDHRAATPLPERQQLVYQQPRHRRSGKPRSEQRRAHRERTRIRQRRCTFAADTGVVERAIRVTDIAVT